MSEARNSLPESIDPASENKVWYLAQNRLFANSSLEAVAGAEHIFKISLLPKRTLVFDQGDRSRIVYLIKRGRVRIARLTADGKEVTVALLGPGDIFGEDALFDEYTRTTVAVCMEETLICAAPASELFSLLSTNPKLALNVAAILSDRLGDASATIEDLAYAKVSERLLHLFERLAGEHGRQTPEGTLLDIRLTHQDIASVIGSTRETVSAELTLLAKAGALKQDGGYIILRGTPAS
jgi:CRP/FNR family cyclic AMP-dependent transcriptional regulator